MVQLLEQDGLNANPAEKWGCHQKWDYALQGLLFVEFLQQQGKLQLLVLCLRLLVALELRCK